MPPGTERQRVRLEKQGDNPHQLVVDLPDFLDNMENYEARARLCLRADSLPLVTRWFEVVRSTPDKMNKLAI